MAPTVATIAPTATIAESPAVRVGQACTRKQVAELTRGPGGVVLICSTVGSGWRWLALAPEPSAAPSARPPVPSTSPALAPGFDGRTISLGVLTTTTHPVWGQIGKAITASIEARVAAINRRGGIAGRYPVRLLFEETGYDPQVTSERLELTKDRVAGYVSILGTPNVEAALGQLERERLLASPASQDGQWATRDSLLPVFNSYQVQAINGIAYYLSQPGNDGHTVCAVSVSTAFGEAGAEGVRFASEQIGFKLGPVISVSASDNAPAASVLPALRAADCRAVFVTVGPIQTVNLVIAARATGYAPRWIVMGASFSERIVTSQTGPAFESSVWVVGDGTQWGDPAVPGMRVLADDLVAADHRYWTENPDIGLTFGWSQMRVFEAVLERAVANNDLSRSGLQRAAREAGPIDLLGLGSITDYGQPVRLANARTTVFAVDNSYRNAIRLLARDFGHPAAARYRR